jgi:hypothetical protein
VGCCRVDQLTGHRLVRPIPGGSLADRKRRHAPRRRGQPVAGPVTLAHVLLAVTGLVLWVIYLRSGAGAPGWAAAGALGGAAAFGLILFTRWVRVHREYVAAGAAALNWGRAPRGTRCRAVRRAAAAPAGPPQAARTRARRSQAASHGPVGKPGTALCPGPHRTAAQGRAVKKQITAAAAATATVLAAGCASTQRPPASPPASPGTCWRHRGQHGSPRGQRPRLHGAAFRLAAHGTTFRAHAPARRGPGRI